MKINGDFHSFSPFVFTWHGAKKGPDRFYAGAGTQKERFYIGFSICIYIDFPTYKPRL
ncbi:hypothetical protein bmyco0003_9400 [Bacillus pseudomycoides]|nr:hypothetical protein bmyco0003_9400 [Bacillus pseudomycoides]